MDLEGKGVLVTGSTRGIGRAVAEAMAAAGADVRLVARNAEALADLAGRVAGTAHPCDLTDPQSVDGLVDRIEAESGPIDVLVNNAGIDATGWLFDQSPAELESLYRLNLITPAELCRQVVPRMLARGRGHIVNVSSLAGVALFPGFAAYGSSKAGLSQLTAGLRADLRGLPVRTTLVELGPVRTEMLADANTYEPTRASFRRSLRVGVLVEFTPDHVATAVVDAAHHNRRHVRLPRRIAPLAALTEAPRRLTELLLTGIPHQPRR